MRVGAAAEVGGGPGRGVRPRHPGLEEEESILQPEGEKGLATVSAGEQRRCPLARKAVQQGGCGLRSRVTQTRDPSPALPLT